MTYLPIVGNHNDIPTFVSKTHPWRFLSERQSKAADISSSNSFDE